MVTAFLGGLHYWWPKMWGRMYSETAGKFGAVVVFVGFNLTFFPQFVMGSQGMPRRYATYLERWQSYHQASTIGSCVIGVGIAIMVGYLVHSLFAGEKARKNHWGGVTLDWLCDTPPVTENFKTPPVWKGEVYDYSTLNQKT